MTILDAVILGTIGVAGLVGISFGFIHVLLGLGGWVGAVLVTLYGFPHLRGPMHDWIGSPLIADAATGIVLFLTTLVVLTALTHFIARSVRKSALGALDRSLGLVFGLFLGVVLVSGAFLIYSRIGELPADEKDRPDWIRKARTVRYVEWTATQLLLIIPPDWGGGPEALPKGEKKPEFDPKATMEKLLEPKTGTAAQPPKEGYNEHERREMDRLFQTQQ